MNFNFGFRKHPIGWRHRMGLTHGNFSLGQPHSQPVMPSEDGRIVIINKNNPVNTAYSGGGGGAQGAPGAGSSPFGGGMPALGEGQVMGPGGQPMSQEAASAGNIATGVASLVTGIAPLLAGASVGPSRPIRRNLSGHGHPIGHVLSGQLLKPLRVYPQSHRQLNDVAARCLLRSKRGTWGLSRVGPTLGLPFQLERTPTPRMSRRARRRLGSADTKNENASPDRGTVIINKIFPTTSSNANSAGAPGCCPPGSIPTQGFPAQAPPSPGVPSIPTYPGTPEQPSTPEPDPRGQLLRRPQPTGQTFHRPVTPVYTEPTTSPVSTPTGVPTGYGGPSGGPGGPGGGGGNGGGGGAAPPGGNGTYSDPGAGGTQSGPDMVWVHTPEGSFLVPEHEADLMEARIMTEQELRRQATQTSVQLPSQDPFVPFPDATQVNIPVQQGTFLPFPEAQDV